MDLATFFQRKLIGHQRHRWAIWQMHRTGLAQMFASRSAAAMRPKEFLIWTLYRNVRRRRPAFVVEFGVGNSTLTMAAALARNDHGSLLSIDADERWIADVCTAVPTLWRERTTVRHRTLEATTCEGEPCHRYAGELPRTPINLLFLDGPNPRDVPGWQALKPMAADPVLLEDRFAPGFRMIVDARFDNVAFLRRHLKRRYRVKTDPVFGVTTFDLLP